VLPPGDGDLKPSAVIPVSEAPLRRVALLGDESLAAVGTDRGELALVRLTDSCVTFRAEAHQGQVSALDASGRLVASSSDDGLVRLWAVEGAALRELLTLRHGGPVRGLALGADGVTLAVLIDGERGVRLWRLDRLRERLAALGLADGLEAIPQTPRALPGGPPPAEVPVEAADGPRGLRAELFDDGDGHRCVQVRHDRQIDWAWSGPPSAARWAGWLKAPAPGRRLLGLETVGAGRLWLDGRVCLYNAGPGRQRQTVEVDLGDGPHALRLDFAADGAAAVRLFWSAPGGAEQTVPSAALFHDRAAAGRAVVRGPRPLALELERVVPLHAAPVRALAAAPGGDVLSGGDGGALRLWSAATGREARRFEGHDATFASLSVSPAATTARAGGSPSARTASAS
jgi:WD40 repeat protein